MTFPDLTVQAHYSRLSWGIVLAASLLFSTQTAAHEQRRRHTLFFVAVAIGLMWLPSAWSPAYWLTGAFQFPSLLTSVLLGLFILSRCSGWPQVELWPHWVQSATITAVGLGLGFSTFGLTLTDLYAVGTKAWLAAGLATVFVLLWWLAGARSTAWNLAAGTSAALYGVTRLPTGNAWDALIDPFIVAFSMVALFRRGYLSLRKWA